MKGFAAPVAVWQVVGEIKAPSRFEAVRGSRLTRLIAREHELGLLMERWEQARSGNGQIALITGEAGIGKSRLVEALSAAVKSADGTRVRLQCSPHHAGSAFFPVIRQIEHTAGFAEGDTLEARLEKLAAYLSLPERSDRETLSLFSELLTLSDGERPGAPTSPAPHLKARTLDALVAQLRRSAEKQPLLVAVEDAHWIDPSTEALLEVLAGQIDTIPALLVVTHRPGYRSPIAGAARVTAISLNQLGPNQVHEMVEAIAENLPEETIQQIVARSGGIPLFVEELTKLVLQSSASGSGVVPETLQSSLLARLDALGAAKKVAQVGSVIGREFTCSLVADVAEVPDNEIDAALGRLVESGLVFARRSEAGTHYIFKHALIQDTAYSSFLKRERARLHIRIARNLERAVTEDRSRAAILAHHFDHGGDARSAIRYWKDAARESYAKSALVESEGQLRSAIAALKRLDDTPERPRLERDLLLDLGATLRAIRGYADTEIEAVFTRAERLCRSLDDASTLNKVRWALMQIKLVQGKLERACAIADDLFAEAARTGDADAKADSALAMGMVRFHLGDLASSETWLRESLRLSKLIHDRVRVMPHGQDPRVFSDGYLCCVLWMRGDTRAAVATMHECLGLARGMPQRLNVISALTFAARLYYCMRDCRRIRRCTGELLSLTDDGGFEYYRAVAKVHHGWALAVGARDPAAIELIDEGIAAQDRIGTVLGLRGLHLQRAEAHWFLGDRMAAIDALTIAHESPGSQCWDAELNRLHGDILSSGTAADQTRAETFYRAGLEIAERQGATAFCDRIASGAARRSPLDNGGNRAFSQERA